MSGTEWDQFEPEQARLRALVEGVNREIAATFKRGIGTEAPTLADAWARLVSGLAISAEPELRQCPFCQRRVPSIATRCRYCLKTSDAVRPAGAASEPSQR